MWVALFTLCLVLATAIQSYMILRAERLTRAALKLSVKQGIGAQKASAQQSADMQASVATAKEANALSRAIFSATDRPWVSIVNATCETMTIDESGVNFSLSFTLQNFGKSPAYGTQTRFINQYVGSKDDQREMIDRQVREALATSENGLLGYMVFPDRPQVSHTPSIRLDFKHMTDPLTEGFIIFGVVFATYRSPSDQSFHVTRFNVTVTHAKRQAGQSVTTTIPANPGEIPVSNIEVRIYMMGIAT